MRRCWSANARALTASYVFANSPKVQQPEKMASNWDMDGERWGERWWFG